MADKRVNNMLYWAHVATQAGETGHVLSFDFHIGNFDNFDNLDNFDNFDIFDSFESLKILPFGECLLISVCMVQK